MRRRLRQPRRTLLESNRYRNLPIKPINEANTRLNKKVTKYLDDFMGDDTVMNSPQHQEAIMLIMRGALIDANFHTEAKMIMSKDYFPKANGRYVGTIRQEMLEEDGVLIAKWAKWNGHDIIDAFAYYTSKTIGAAFGAKLQTLKEVFYRNL